MWHENCLQNSCKFHSVLSSLQALIPADIPADFQRTTADFSRERKLPFPKLVTLVLSLACSGKHKGLVAKCQEFFRMANRNGVWQSNSPPHHSAVSKARKKIPWEVFKNIFHDAVDLAYQHMPDDKNSTWNGLRLFAIDGSKHNLPATPHLRSKYEPNSGLDIGQNHYPQCLVSTAYDVLRKIPVARCIESVNSSERAHGMSLLPDMPTQGVIIFDKGYPSYNFMAHLQHNYNGYYLIKCPASGTFNQVLDFVNSPSTDQIIQLLPGSHLLAKAKKDLSQRTQPLTVRCIKHRHADGSISVFLTNLLDREIYSEEELRALYRKRWEAEVQYRDEKLHVEIETFHSRTENGILQEFYALLIMQVITKILTTLTPPHETAKCSVETQHKASLMAIARDAAILTPSNFQKALSLFMDLINELKHMLYYRPLTPKPSQSRVCKRAKNKWIVNRGKTQKEKAMQSQKA